MDQPLVKAAAFEPQPVVAQHLAVVAYEDDEGVLALPGPLERVEDAPLSWLVY